MLGAGEETDRDAPSARASRAGVRRAGADADAGTTARGADGAGGAPRARRGAAAGAARHPGGARLRSRRGRAGDRARAQSQPCRSARRDQLLPAFPQPTLRPSRAVSLPRRGVSGDGRARARGGSEAAARHRFSRDHRGRRVHAGAGVLSRQLRLRAVADDRPDAARPRRRGAVRGAARRSRRGTVSATVYVSRDASALAVGAERVAGAIAAEAARRGTGVRIVRTGSRGLFWLEPMVEVATPAGRIAYGPVSPEHVDEVLSAALADAGPHRLRLGRPEDLSFLRRQTRLTFARCGIVDPLSLDDYRAHGGLRGIERALSVGPAAITEEVVQSGLRGRGGAGFPTGVKWRTAAEAAGAQKYIVCNADE